MNKLTLARQALLLVAAMTWPFAANAQEYGSGHQALQVWDAAAMAGMPLWVKIWLAFMAVVFASGLVFVKRHTEARWLVGGFALGLLFTTFAVPMLGLVPLSGLVALVHLVFWSPALYLMLRNRPFVKYKSIYGVWSGIATACILFSFLFDFRDAYIYLTNAAFVTR